MAAMAAMCVSDACGMNDGCGMNDSSDGMSAGTGDGTTMERRRNDDGTGNGMIDGDGMSGNTSNGMSDGSDVRKRWRWCERWHKQWHARWHDRRQQRWQRTMT